ncbi:uncharacterized protein LOC135715579 [Ochlerotatus camptorhynchus]|uniref:uncharacterized protein LOC135715579 n=1 Tax=Ochlerotatus camptorhynchus TaxID=644619 RepID=UPI0031D9170C
MPKDLPPFRGDPEDWPLFYSAYLNSTTACGYTDVENLARIQRALQASDDTVIADTNLAKSNKSDKARERNYLNAHSAEDLTKKHQSSKQELPSPVLCLACEEPQVKDCTIYKKMDAEHHWIITSAARALNNITKEEPKSTGTAGETSERVNAHHNPKQSVLFKFLPVRLFWKGKSVETFAFLDDGSNMTLVEDWVAKRLGIDDGEDLPLCMSWTSNVTRYEPKSQRVSVEISGVSQSGKFMLNDTRTVKNLSLPRQSLNYEELVHQHSHLKGLPLSSYESVSPGILIGSKNASLIAALKVKEGQLGDPIASKTRLGWTLSGMAEEGDSSVKVSLHICARSQEDELHDMVKKFFSVDSVGVAADKGPESNDDKCARSILERTTRRVDNQYETGLLWRYDHFKFPDSFGMAKRRLECFERRMKADPELRESVHRQIDEYLQSGYIHLTTPEELKSANSDRVWYLPLGAVRNPKKPGKIRLIWDAAAKAGGVSFNSMLLKGPDLLTPLLTVVFGFRERKVARFLFRKDPSHPIQVYIMDVGTFRSTCSPSQAQFIKNMNAEEHKETFPRAAAAIQLSMLGNGGLFV